MHRIVLVSCLVLLVLGFVTAQRKPGDCPPPSDVGVCALTCHNDGQCRGDSKCCRTSCAGSICMRPVTARQPQNLREKAGYCPERPSGPWVCSSRCAVDGDCRANSKCCKNRCGALACMKPEGI